ncbi:MAG TPA: helix-turn-helix domain-containing protein [Geobacteraceae bacterium]|nr:helix-turn-helix domain-containing protein [Geobacteraceae bacterium]
MIKLTITTGTVTEFFQRGRTLARKLDKGERILPENIITFEDPEEILELITAARVDLFRAVKDEPGSIADIARRLHRDRSAVKRDVDILAAAGLVRVESKPISGHGRMKFVTAVADSFQLTAQVA